MIDSFSRYLKTSQPDYAVMLDGPWGSGKTYWVRHSLIPRATELGYHSIYVSAASADSSGELERAIILARIMKRGEAQSVDPGLMQAIAGVVQELPSGPVTKAVSRSLGSVARSAGKAYSRGLSFTRTLIVVDDLERVSSGASPQELLGHIFQRFVDSGGAHLVVVGNLRKLTEGPDGAGQSPFDAVREKYIRLVVPFRPSRRQQIKELAAVIEDESIRNAAERAISGFAEEHTDFNLRAVQYVVSHIQALETVLAEFSTQLSTEDVVTTMLVFATELAEGRVSPTDAEGLMALVTVEERESLRRQMRDNAGLATEEANGADELRKRYGRLALRRLVPLRFIADMLTGHDPTDEDEAWQVYAKAEIARYLRDGKSPEISALDDLAGYYVHEFEDVNELGTRVLTFAEQGKYEAERYPYITSLMEYLIRRGFLEKVTEDWFDRLRNGVERSLEGRTDYRFVGNTIDDVVVNNIYDNTVPKPQCVLDMIQLVTERLRGAFEKHINDTALTFFMNLEIIPENERGSRYREVRGQIDFRAIDAEEFVTAVVHMNNSGLYWVGIILDDLFQHSMDSEGLSRQKASLATIKKTLEYHWGEEKDVDPLRRDQRAALLSKLREYGAPRRSDDQSGKND